MGGFLTSVQKFSAPGEAVKQIAEGLWIVDRPFSMFGLQLGRRMVVVRLDDGTLLLHAPVPIDDATAAALGECGEVRHLVAPNLMHHLALPSAAERFPAARIYAPPGLERKQPALALLPLPTGDDGPWAGVLAQQPIDGAPALGETVFLHRPSRALICTDLVFHFRQAEGALTRFYLRMSGAFGRMAQTRVLRSMIRDRAAARASIDRVLAWDFDRVVMAHGQVLEHGGREALRDATAWL